jgi:hypothetical protein
MYSYKQITCLVEYQTERFCQTNAIEDGEILKILQRTQQKLKPKPVNIPFEAFWELYDKKVDSHSCKKKWARLSDKDREAAMKYIPGYKKAQPDKKFRKNPLTYLNRMGWEDELIKAETEKVDQPTKKIEWL